MPTDEKDSGTIEAVEVVKGDGLPSDGYLHTREEEKRLVRRLDMRLMPVLCALYLFACEFATELLRHEKHY